MERINSITNSDIILNNKAKKNLEIIKDKLHVASILCSKSNIYFNRVKMILIIPNLLLSSVGVIVNNNNHIEPEILKIINTVINALTLLLIGIHTSFKISEASDTMKSGVVSLTKLLHTLESFENSDLLTAEHINQTTLNYDVIMSNLTDFPQHIRKNVQKEYATQKHLPICINGIKKTIIERTISNEV